MTAHDPHTRPDFVQNALDRAYDAFSGYRPGARLQICRCENCVSPSAERRLHKGALRAIDAADIEAYLGSAHAMASPEARAELKYFLPRVLELAGSGVWPYHAVEYSFCKLAEAELGEWPVAERAAVRAVFAALFAYRLTQRPSFRATPPEDMLAAFANAGETIGFCLDLWDADYSETASLAIAEVAIGLSATEPGVTPAQSLLLNDRMWNATAEHDRLVDWLARPETALRLEAAAAAACKPAYVETFVKALARLRLQPAPKPARPREASVSALFPVQAQNAA